MNTLYGVGSVDQPSYLFCEPKHSAYPVWSILAPVVDVITFTDPVCGAATENVNEILWGLFVATDDDTEMLAL